MEHEAPRRLIHHIVGLIATLVSSVGTVMILTPAALNRPWMWLGTVGSAAIAWLAAAVLSIQRTKESLQRYLRRLLITGGVSLGLLIASVIIHFDLVDRYTFVHHGVELVSGSEYQPHIEEAMKGKPPLTPSQLMDRLPQYEPEDIWTRESIARRKAALRFMFFISIAMVVFTIVFASYGVQEIVRQRRH